MASPLIVNPDAVPVSVALEIVTLDPPEFFSVADWLLLLPTCTLPKLTGLTVIAPEVAPLPERATIKLEEGLLVVIARLTLLLTADVGANTTLNEVLAPAARVTGKVKPCTVYPAPAAVCVKVMLEPPELVTVSGRDFVLLTVTLPKARLEALAESVPGVAELPVTAAVSEGFEALLVTENVKLSVPAEVGAKTTLNATLWPAANVSGKVRPVVL